MFSWNLLVAMQPEGISRPLRLPVHWVVLLKPRL